MAPRDPQALPTRFPFGEHDAESRRLVEAAGYRAAFAAWGPPIVDASAPRWQIPRVAVLRAMTMAEFTRPFVRAARHARASETPRSLL